MDSAPRNHRFVVAALRWRHRLHIWSAYGSVPVAVVLLAALVRWQDGGSWLGALLSATLWSVVGGVAVLGYWWQINSMMRSGLTQACNGHIKIVWSADALELRVWGRSGLLRAKDIESLCFYWDGNFDGIRGIVDAMAIRLRTGETIPIPEDADGFGAISAFAAEHDLPMSRVEVE